LAEFKKFLLACKAKGVRIVEIPVPLIQIPHRDLISAFKETDMEVALCMFFGDINPLGDGRDEALKKLVEAAVLAKDFFKAGVVCHGITGPWAIKILGEGTMEAATDFVRKVAEIAEKYWVCFHLEPLRHIERSDKQEDRVIGTVKNVIAILEKVGCELLGLHLDTYHADRNEPDGLYKCIIAVKKWLTYLHVSDTFRNIIGWGNIDWRKVAAALDEIGYEGPVVIEVFSEKTARVLSDIAAGHSAPQPFEVILVESVVILQTAGIVPLPLEDQKEEAERRG
jgi:D-psicose/D-tagatose/L-ribulose 3-epimerase